MFITQFFYFQTKREVVDAMSDLKIFKSTLEENKYSLNVIEQVLTASINLSSDNLAKLSLADRIKNMQTTKEILSNNEHLSKLNVYKHLMREHQRLMDVLRLNCVTTWRKQIEWLENNTDCQDSWRAMLKISGCQEDISDSIFALQYFDCLNAEVQQFSNKLIDTIFKPIISQNLHVDLSKSLNVSTMTLKVSNNTDEGLSPIIEQLTNVFEFLNSTLPVNINEIKIMSHLGYYANQEFCNIFKEIALLNAVPTKYNQLNDFRNEIKKILEFNDYLCKLGNTITMYLFYLFIQVNTYSN